MRAAAAEGARAAGRQAGGSEGDIVGLLAALFTEGALVAMDKPDTRSWQFLPRWIYVYRQPLDPGTHDVWIDVAGEQRSFEVEIPAEGYAAVVLTDPR